jgi:hypothetical protein
MCISFHVKYPLFLTDFSATGISSTDFRKILKYKFHENLSSGNRVVPYRHIDGQADRNDKTDNHFSQFWERP